MPAEYRSMICRHRRLALKLHVVSVAVHYMIERCIINLDCIRLLRYRLRYDTRVIRGSRKGIRFFDPIAISRVTAVGRLISSQ